METFWLDNIVFKSVIAEKRESSLLYRFEINDSDTDKILNIDETYTDIYGKPVKSQIIISSYEAVILIKKPL